ncbi:MAG: hypothetical protein ACR2NI_04425 [Pirellulales bacterium]
MLKSQKLLKADGTTNGGSRIELISWTETDPRTLERFNVHRIDVDDKTIWIGTVLHDCDSNGWSAQEAFSYFSVKL